MEGFAFELSKYTNEEIRIFAEVAAQNAVKAKNSNSSKEWIDFYDNVIDNLGLSERLPLELQATVVAI